MDHKLNVRKLGTFYFLVRNLLISNRVRGILDYVRREFQCKNYFFFKMKNNQSQLQIQYNSRVKEREKKYFKKRNIFAARSLKERGGAQYNVNLTLK